MSNEKQKKNSHTVKVKEEIEELSKKVLDIDFNPKKNKYNKLYYAIRNKDLEENSFELYSSEVLNSIMLENLTEKEKYIIDNRFGLTLEDSGRTLKDLANEFGVSSTYIADIEKKALHKLRNSLLRERYSYDLRLIEENEQVLNNDEKKIIKDLIDKLIGKDNEEYKKMCTQISCENKGNFSFIKNINQRIREARNIVDIKIEELELPIRVYWYFKRLGVEKLKDVSLLTLEQIKEIEKFSKKSFSDVMKQLKEYNITFSESITNKEGIIRKYGTIENFMDLYRNGQIEIKEEYSLIKNVLDIDTYTDKYDKLFYEIIKKDPQDNKIQLYSSEKLKSIMLEALNEREIYVLKRRYGLEDCPQKLATIGNEIGVSFQRVGTIIISAHNKLKHPSKRKKYCYDLEDLGNKEILTNEEKNTIDKFINNLYESEILIKNNSDKNENINEFIENTENIEGMKLIKNISNIIKERKNKIEEERIKNRDVNDIEIEEINLSCRTYSILNRAGINTLGKISNLTEDELKIIRGIGERSINEIKEVLAKYGLTLKLNRSELQKAKSKKDELQRKCDELKAKIYETEEELSKYNQLENMESK